MSKIQCALTLMMHNINGKGGDRIFLAVASMNLDELNARLIIHVHYRGNGHSIKSAPLVYTYLLSPLQLVPPAISSSQPKIFLPYLDPPPPR